MGVSLSLLLFRYTGAPAARIFVTTAAAFGALRPLRLHHVKARPDGIRQVPLHGADRPDPGQPREHAPPPPPPPPRRDELHHFARQAR